MQSEISLEEIVKFGDFKQLEEFVLKYGMISLEFEDWGIKEAAPIVCALQRTTVLELSLAGNPIEDFESLFESLTGCPDLKSLWLDATGLGDEAIVLLSKYLPKMKLEHLYLRSNFLTDKGVRELISQVRSTLPPINIETIDISFNPGVSEMMHADLVSSLSGAWQRV